MKNRPLIESLNSWTPLAGGYALGGHVGGQRAKVIILRPALHKRRRLTVIQSACLCLARILPVTIKSSIALGRNVISHAASELL